MNRTDFGKRVFQEFNFQHWIEIRKGQMLYMYFIMDEKRNTLTRSKFYDEMDECLEAARNRLSDMLCEDAENKNINSICYNCRRYKGECRGTSEQAFTGCIYREVR